MAEDHSDQAHGTLTASLDDATATISRGVVSVYARLYGRGPTHARTYVQADYVLTVLEESFTVAERTLLRAGKVSQVEDMRRAFQEAVAEDFIEIVEGATGREVDTYVSQVDAASETAVEVFLLKPSNGNGGVRS